MTRGGTLAACAGHQFVLEIFLHDRLAGRLDGGAGTAGAADRAAAAKSRRSRCRRCRRSPPKRRSTAATRWRRSSAAIEENRRILIDGSAAGRPRASSCPPTARSTSMPTFRISPPTVSSSPSEMLEQAHVAATPGIDFDPVHGRAFIRFSYARSAEEMREAVARIARWLRRRRLIRRAVIHSRGICHRRGAGAIDSDDPIDFGCVGSAGRRRMATDRSARFIGGVNVMAAAIATAAPARAAETLVQGSLCPGADRDPARRPGRLAVAASCHQRLDQGARRRLHQADQDGDRADHLLHRGVRHLPYPGCPKVGRVGVKALVYFEVVSTFALMIGLVVGNLVPVGRGLRRARPDAAAVATYAKQAEAQKIGRLRPQHHSGQRGRRVGARRHPAGAAVRHPVRLCADGARRARPSPA